MFVRDDATNEVGGGAPQHCHQVVKLLLENEWGTH